MYTTVRLAVVLLGALLLTGCIAVQPVLPAPPRPVAPGGAVSPGTPVRDGGDLVMGLSSEPDRLDPTTSSSLYTRYVMSSICEKLYDIDAEGTVLPQLATALPKVSADGRSVEITVRDGVRFADGTPLDAAAVVTTLRRHLTLPDSSRRSELGPVAGIDATGPRTVQIRYERPFAPLTASLADRAGMIMSPTALARPGVEFSADPVCVGPFRFAERIPQTSITVVRDPLYYAADEVHLDSITYRIMNDANIRAANLRSGDVDVADTISPQDVDALSRETDVRVLQIPSLGYQAMTVNIGNTAGTGNPPGRIDTPLARDPRVRRALALSVDRTVLVNAVFNNWYEPACSPIPPGSTYASPASDACPPYDPEESRRLLASAGAPVPYPVTMKVSNSPDTLRLAQALQAAVAQGGFAITVEPVEYSTLLDVQDRGDFDLLQLGWSGRVDPHGNIASFLTTGAGSNYSGYSDAGVDELIRRAAATIDPAARAALYGQVVERVQRDNPIIYLYRQRNLTAHSADVVGVQTFADGVVRLSRAAFVDGEVG